MKVTQAYRFALDQTPADERAFRSHAGASRFAWNWGLGKCKERYEAEGKWYSATDMHKLWNAEKKADPALAWWSENSKCAYQEAFRDLDRALRDFIKSKKGHRKGKRLGFPAFKKRGKCKDSFRFTTGAIRCGQSAVTLPRIGTVRTHESTRKLVRRLENGTALGKLRRASRAHSRKRPGSANRRKSAGRLARIHARAASIRGDALHKATSELGRRYETVVAEDLNVTGMTRNHRLARDGDQTGTVPRQRRTTDERSSVTVF